MPAKDPKEALRNRLFGNRLETLLEDRGLTQADLGRKLGIAPSSVNRWTRGTFPEFRTRLVIAGILDVTIAYLDYGEDDDMAQLGSLISIPE